MSNYDLQFRKIGDGYTYFKFYTPNPGGVSPFGEPSLIQIMADNASFGGTDPAGAAIAIEREILEDNISQELAPIQRLIVGEKATLKITVEAGRLTNVAILEGVSPSDIESVSASALPGDKDGHAVFVGGRTANSFFGIVHQVVNSFSPDLNEYFYAPRCQAGDGWGYTYVRNAVRVAELIINIFPALQSDFVVEGDRHALAQIIFEHN